MKEGERVGVAGLISGVNGLWPKQCLILTAMRQHPPAFRPEEPALVASGLSRWIRYRCYISGTHSAAHKEELWRPLRRLNWFN